MLGKTSQHIDHPQVRVIRGNIHCSRQEIMHGAIQTAVIKERTFAKREPIVCNQHYSIVHKHVHKVGA